MIRSVNVHQALGKNKDCLSEVETDFLADRRVDNSIISFLDPMQCDPIMLMLESTNSLEDNVNGTCIVRDSKRQKLDVVMDANDDRYINDKNM